MCITCCCLSTLCSCIFLVLFSLVPFVCIPLKLSLCLAHHFLSFLLPKLWAYHFFVVYQFILGDKFLLFHNHFAFPCILGVALWLCVFVSLPSSKTVCMLVCTCFASISPNCILVASISPNCCLPFHLCSTHL